MDKRNTRILLVYVTLALAINIFLAAAHIDWAKWGDRPNLDFSKDFANDIVLAMQELAVDLGVAEKANIKQALAKLHYDVYLAANSKELAGIIQNTASDTRDLIVAEYVNSSAEQVLKILNEAPEVQAARAKTTIKIEPRREGGYRVAEPHDLSAETLAQLGNLSTLFSIDVFRENYVDYLALTSMQIEIEEGTARRVVPSSDQDTIKYWEREIQNLRNEYRRVTRLAGLAEASGPGITITLRDKYFPMEAGDLRRIVSEIYSAGATAISINGQRLAVNSFIIDEDAGICIDGTLIDTNPVEIQALGDPQTLFTGIDLLFSVVFMDMFYVSMESHEDLILPGKVIQ